MKKHVKLVLLFCRMIFNNQQISTYFKNISIWLLLFSHCFSSNLFSQDEELSYVASKDDINFHLALQLKGSGDYATSLENNGATGYLHWLAFDVGFGFRIKDNIFLAPRLNWLTSRVKYISTFNQYTYSTENAKVTSVLIPGVTCRYYFNDLERLYALASVGFTASVSSEVFREFNFEGDGLVLGCGAGYEFSLGSRKLVVEIGYDSVPIKYSYSSYGYLGGHGSQKWGGIFLTIGSSFDITNY